MAPAEKCQIIYEVVPFSSATYVMPVVACQRRPRDLQVCLLPLFLPGYAPSSGGTFKLMILGTLEAPSNS